MRSLLAVAVVCAFGGSSFAQDLSIGFIGGTHFTHSFVPRFEANPADPFNPANRFTFESGPRSFIAGAALEGRFSDAFSIEADVLHRPLKSRITFTELFADGTTRTTTQTQTAVRTWEFPVLLKYQLKPTTIAAARPFVTVGPSFRTQEDATATEPSQFGITVGVGFTVPMGRFRLSPTLRYTRWRSEDVAPRYATKPDQLEILGSFAYETDSNARRIMGTKFEVGGILGLPLTNGFERIGPGEPDREKFRYLAGLTAQADIADRWALEIDGIYRPLRAVDRRELTRPDGMVFDYENDYSLITWEFPVLAKRRLSESDFAPFVAGGPSFRLAGNLNGYEPSKVGATVGFGVEKRVGIARWSSTVRYTRWARDDGRIRTNPNSLEALIGVSF
jgi:hypothetical protein